MAAGAKLVESVAAVPVAVYPMCPMYMFLGDMMCKDFSGDHVEVSAHEADGVKRAPRSSMRANKAQRNERGFRT